MVGLFVLKLRRLEVHLYERDLKITFTSSFVSSKFLNNTETQLEFCKIDQTVLVKSKSDFVLHFMF